MAKKTPITKKASVVKEMITVEKSIYVNLTRRVRTLEVENDKLIAHMKIISEAASESQTRVRVYSQRADAPAEKRPSRSNGNRVQQRNTGQILRGKEALSVDGVQVSTLNSTPYKPDFRKGKSETEPTPAKVGGPRDW